MTQMADQINRDRFIALPTERFPYVAAAIDDCSRGLLHRKCPVDRWPDWVPMPPA
jgi:hypothetical protein